MGYTHYWEGGVTLTPEIVKDVKKIVKASEVSICGGDGTGKPTITTEIIELNGDESKGENYETFQVRTDSPAWNFCKTAQRPYDEVVTAILLRLAEDGLIIRSDGTRADWADGEALYTKALGHEPVVTLP